MKGSPSIRYETLVAIGSCYRKRRLAIWSRLNDTSFCHGMQPILSYHARRSISPCMGPLSTAARYSKRFLGSNIFDDRKRPAKTLYEELGILPNATQTEIRKAFIKLAKQFHPDMQGQQQMEIPTDGQQKPVQDFGERFRKIRMAYGILSNETSRREYDWRSRGIWSHSPTSVRRPSGSSTLDAEILFSHVPGRRARAPSSIRSDYQTVDLKFEEPPRFRYTEAELEEMEAAEAARQLEFNILRQTRIRDLGKRREASRIKEYAAAREQYLARLVEVDTAAENHGSGRALPLGWRIFAWVTRFLFPTTHVEDATKKSARSAAKGVATSRTKNKGVSNGSSCTHSTQQPTAREPWVIDLQSRSNNMPLRTAEHPFPQRPLYCSVSPTVNYDKVVQKQLLEM